VALYFTPQWGDISRPNAGAFIHGQRPCLHAGVGYGTQAWPSAAGVKTNSHLSRITNMNQDQG